MKKHDHPLQEMRRAAAVLDNIERGKKRNKKRKFQRNKEQHDLIV